MAKSLVISSSPAIKRYTITMVTNTSYLIITSGGGYDLGRVEEVIISQLRLTDFE